MRMRQLFVPLVALFYSAPALAQSHYVAAAIGADVFRPSHVEARGIDDPSGAGEAVAVSARVGTAVTDRWGAELGLTRAAEIEREVRRGGPIPLVRPLANVIAVSTTAFPIFETTVRLTRRDTTLDAVAWVAQTLTGRLDLVYIGGVAFTRAVQEVEYQLPRAIAPVAYVVPPTRTTTYGAGPVVGIAARVRLTSRTLLVPDVRLNTVGSERGTGWIVRPSVAFAWRF